MARVVVEEAMIIIVFLAVSATLAGLALSAARGYAPAALPEPATLISYIDYLLGAGVNATLPVQEELQPGVRLVELCVETGGSTLRVEAVYSLSTAYDLDAAAAEARLALEKMELDNMDLDAVNVEVEHGQRIIRVIAVYRLSTAAPILEDGAMCIEPKSSYVSYALTYMLTLDATLTASISLEE